MTMRSARHAKQRRDVDVDSIRGNLLAAQLKYVGEGKGDDRSVVSCIGNFAFTAGRFAGAPARNQTMLARSDGSEESRHGGTDFPGALNHRRIAEAKLRVRSQEADKPRRIARVNRPEQAFPPIRIRQRLGSTLSAVPVGVIANHRNSIRPTRSAAPYFRG